MKEFLDILKVKLTKQGLIEALEVLEKNKKEEIEYALEEGFSAKFFKLENPVQFHSLHSIFSDARQSLIDKIKKENKIETKWGEMCPVVFLIPLALMDKDLEIMQEGGLEFRKRIEKILTEKGIKVKNHQDFLSKENQVKTMEVLLKELKKGNLTFDEIFWYFFIVCIESGYSTLKYRDKKKE